MKTLHQNLPIPACSKDTIARADDVFTGYIDSDFTNWNLDVKSPKTEAMEVAVLEMDKDATFKEMFGSVSKDTDSMCMTQAQIITFMKEHKDKLRTDGYGTLFLFKNGVDFFVANVYFDDVGQLGVYADRLSRDGVWYAEARRRIVVLATAIQTHISSPSDALSALTLEAAVARVKQEGYVIFKPV